MIDLIFKNYEFINNMKITSLVLAFFGCSFSIALKAQIPLIAEDEQGSLRVIGYNKINQNCNSGDIIEAVFPISNISMDTIYISQVVPDCVCTHYAFPEKGIPPGEIDTIYLFLMSKNVPPGAFYKRAIVDFNDGSMELIIEGNISIVRPIIKPGERPIIYKPKQIRVLNSTQKEENSDEKLH